MSHLTLASQVLSLITLVSAWIVIVRNRRNFDKACGDAYQRGYRHAMMRRERVLTKWAD